MIPILYEKNTEEFKDNGIGRLADAITCKVTEERNGEYELSMTHPVSSELFSEIQNDRVILATPFKGGKPQAFDIYQVNPALGGKVQIYAHHASYRANFIPVKPFQTHDRPGIDTAIERLNNNVIIESPFKVKNSATSPITNTTTPFQILVPQSLRACLGGTEGSLLDTYSGQGTGEYEWDNFDIIIHAHRGADRGEYIRYGKNMQSLDRELDSADLATGVIVYWQAEDSPACYFSDIAWNESLRDLFGDKVTCIDITSEFEMAPTKESLNEVAAEKAAKLDPIKDEVEVEFYDEDDMDVRLCDTVHVIYKRFGIVKDMDVIKTVWDVLNDKYEKITLGKKKSSLSDTLYNAQIESKEYTNSKMISVTQYVDRENGLIENQIQAITGTKGNYLALVSPLYLRKESGEPGPSDTWSEIFPGGDSGNSFWVKYIAYYENNETKEYGPYQIPNDLNPQDAVSALTQYYVTDQNEIPEDAIWGYDIPMVPPGFHLWVRTELVFESGSADSKFTTPFSPTNSLYTTKTQTGTTVIQTEEEFTSIAEQIVEVQSSASWVNFSPFFSHPFADVTQGQLDEYWKVNNNPNWLTQLEDGWAHVSLASQGSIEIAPVALGDYIGDDATLLMEIRNPIYTSGTLHITSIASSSSSGGVTRSAQYTFNPGDTDITNPDDGPHIIKISRPLGIQNPNVLIDIQFKSFVGSQFTGSFDVRFSIYKDGYKGDYIPYIANGEDLSIYAENLRETVSKTTSTLNQTNDLIQTLVSDTTEIKEKYVTKDGLEYELSSYTETVQSMIDQKADEIGIKITKTQTYAEGTNTKLDNTVGKYFSFNEDGLDIIPIGEGGRHTANFKEDGMRIYDTNGYIDTWLTAEDGLGGRKVSIGDPDDRSLRWLIIPNDDASELRFLRHS